MDSTPLTKVQLLKNVLSNLCASSPPQFPIIRLQNCSEIVTPLNLNKNFCKCQLCAEFSPCSMLELRKLRVLRENDIGIPKNSDFWTCATCRNAMDTLMSLMGRVEQIVFTLKQLLDSKGKDNSERKGINKSHQEETVIKSEPLEIPDDPLEEIEIHYELPTIKTEDESKTEETESPQISPFDLKPMDLDNESNFSLDLNPTESSDSDEEYSPNSNPPSPGPGLKTKTSLSAGKTSHFANYIQTDKTKYEPFRCTICSKKFRIKQKARDHIENIHFQITKYTCEHCSKGFFRNHTFKKHVVACAAGRLDRLRQSAALKGPDGLYHCDDCNRTFTRFGSWNIHRKSVHLKQFPFSCPNSNCSRQFARNDQLKRHREACDAGRLVNRHKLAALRAENQGLLKCPHCPFSVKRSSELTVHISNTHLKIVRFKCGQCAKGFYKRRARDIHQTYCEKSKKNDSKKKMEGNMFDCEECDKKFSYAHGLKAHMESVHLKVVRFSCKECDRGFYKKQHRDSHQSNCERRSKVLLGGPPALEKYDKDEEIEGKVETEIYEGGPPRLNIEEY